MQTKLEHEKKEQNIIITSIFLIILIPIIYTITYLNQTKVEEKLDGKELTDIKIIATEEQIELLKNSAKLIAEDTMSQGIEDEPYIKVDVIINGKLIKNCGLRTKGTSIYRSILTTSKPERYSYRLELDYYIKNQNYDGIKKFFLNTGAFDKTAIKEVICYDIYELANVKVPKRSLCNLTIGEKNEGIYTIVEIAGEEFLKRNYGYQHGILYKPQFSRAQGQSAFLYRGDLLEYYEVIAKGEKYGRTFDIQKWNNYLEALKSIQTNTNMEEYVDIPSIIDYLVVSMLINNGDSMVDVNSKNFYIYQEGKKLTILPFDLDLYFRNSKSINRPILNYATFNTSDQQKPIFYNILTNKTYQEEYKEKIEKLINKLEDENYIYNQIDKYNEIISKSIQTNENNFYTYEEQQKAIEIFKEAIKLRLSSAKKQLEANIWNEYIEYETPIDVSYISAM